MACCRWDECYAMHCNERRTPRRLVFELQMTGGPLKFTPVTLTASTRPLPRPWFKQFWIMHRFFHYQITRFKHCSVSLPADRAPISGRLFTHHIPNRSVLLTESKVRPAYFLTAFTRGVHWRESTVAPILIVSHAFNIDRQCTLFTQSGTHSLRTVVLFPTL